MDNGRFMIDYATTGGIIGLSLGDDELQRWHWRGNAVRPLVREAYVCAGLSRLHDPLIDALPGIVTAHIEHSFQCLDLVFLLCGWWYAVDDACEFEEFVECSVAVQFPVSGSHDAECGDGDAFAHS